MVERLVHADIYPKMSFSDRILVLCDEEGLKFTAPFDCSLIEEARKATPNALVMKKIGRDLIGIDYEYYKDCHGTKRRKGHKGPS